MSAGTGWDTLGFEIGYKDTSLQNFINVQVQSLHVQTNRCLESSLSVNETWTALAFLCHYEHMLHVHVLCKRQIVYRIAGNFRMVQNFTLFVDRSAVAKVRTTKYWMASTVRMWWWVCARKRKFLLRGWQAISQNFPAIRYHALTFPLRWLKRSFSPSLVMTPLSSP